VILDNLAAGRNAEEIIESHPVVDETA